MRITLVGSRHFGVTTFDMLRRHGVDIVRVVVADAEGFSRPVRVGVGDEVRELHAGERWAFALDRETSTAR